MSEVGTIWLILRGNFKLPWNKLHADKVVESCDKSACISVDAKAKISLPNYIQLD